MWGVGGSSAVNKNGKPINKFSEKTFSGTLVKSYKLAGPILSPWGVPLITYSINWALGLKLWRQVSGCLYSNFLPPPLD